MRPFLLRILLAVAASIALAATGCGGGVTAANSSNALFSISPGTGSIDTNCTGCNGSSSSAGTGYEQFTASLAGGGPASVVWSVSGGDPDAGAGSIDAATGRYTPPSHLTQDSAQVKVTATLTSSPGTAASALLTVTPGFLQPLAPENVALGANGTVTVTGFIAEVGGSTGIGYAVSNSAAGSGGGQGSLSNVNCQRSVVSSSNPVYTSCTVTYTAPPTVAATEAIYLVATIGSSPSKANSEILLNTAGISSNPATHQAQLNTPVQLGASGGNNKDYDTATQNGKTYVTDCCGGTLGSLLQGSNGNQYLLSNNHVLARSDQASVGETIVQPGLIDNNCTPYGEGSGIASVGSLTGWVALGNNANNVDAAIAQAASGAVDPSGSILELGGRQADGTLAAAPPGISSTGGKGEAPSLSLKVAKSGRTTGLTCASISAINLDVQVGYYRDCAETQPYLNKTYTNQIAISGNQFSDAGDSGSLVVDSSNAEPVGLFFAGGTDASGVGQGVANPATEVLTELGSQVGGGTVSYSFVGTADHAVSCLSYGSGTAAVAQARLLSGSENWRAHQALSQAHMLVNPSAGVLGVATGKSNDHPGEAAVIVYVDENAPASSPAIIGGVRTLVIPTNARALAAGAAPHANSAVAGLAAAVLNQALAIKQQMARSLMRQNPAFFGVGVGQSLDNPKEAALVIYVDRKNMPATLPQTVGGLRTRYIVMDRLHVTRSYATPLPSRSRCVAHPAPGKTAAFDPLSGFKLRRWQIN